MRLSMLRPVCLKRTVPSLIKPSQAFASLSTTSSSGATKPNIDFNDSKTSFKNKSLPELLRGKLVFTTCQIRYLVERSESLVKLSYKILGFKLTNWGLKKTFFGHFCAGEDEESIRPTVKRLEVGGVGSILDYAAESDVQENAEGGEPTVQINESTTVGKVQGRVYDYKNEELCDIHKATFVKAIIAVHNVSPTGFAAIKVTALGDPELLKRASVTLTEIKNLFHRLDVKNTGFVSKQAFLETFNTKIEGKDVLNYFNHLDSDQDEKINYIEWTNGLLLEELHLLTAHCTQEGPLSASVLNEEERVLLSKMKSRITSLAELAETKGVRLMIDAEHTYFQPAIDQITNELAKKFNRPGHGKQPVIFSTYQMYLRDSYDRLITDMDRAKRGGYTFAAKLVRGAYMVLERQHASTHGMCDPIHVNMQATHDNYNAGIREAIRRISVGEKVEIMIASHNQQSIELTIAEMQRLSLSPETTAVYFGQLLGMADQLTFSLGGAGYKAYKYVPYGRVHEVMPYLIRRAQENSDALSGAKKELTMINAEIKRRIFG